MADSWTYRRAGVDIGAGARAVRRIAPLARATRRPEVLGGLGGFGGLFRLSTRRWRSPVLVAATDGVGTKLKVAFALGEHRTVGIDLVAMSVNDIVVQGAEPLFFLDYLSCGRLEPARVAEVVTGIAEGCAQAGCALLGGETAEMPGFYPRGEYDLAGFAVGAVERGALVDGRRVRPGDRLLALPSSGLHSNGFSLVRALVGPGRRRSWRHRPAGWERPLGEVLLEPTRIYVRPLLRILRRCRVTGLVHVTGGGLKENIPRVLPGGCSAEIVRGSWEIPEIFRWLQAEGKIGRAEMFRTFNMGIGMLVIARPRETERIRSALKRSGERSFVIGRVVPGPRRVRFV